MFQIFTILISLIVIVITYYRWSFGYWKRRNLPWVNATFPFGSMQNPLKRKTQLGVRMKAYYDDLKSRNHRHGGIYVFTLPMYFAVDPDIVKNILQKDFDCFTERGFYHNEKDEPLSGNLFILGGQRWRNLRTKLTPTFTSGKMKMMLDTLLQCGIQMEESIKDSCTRNEAVDIKEVAARYTTDVIGSCAFGLECNSFKNPDAEFRKYGKLIFESLPPLMMLKIVFGFFRPNIARKLGVKLFRDECSDFFLNIVKETVKYREDNSLVRKDMLQVMIDLKNDPSVGLTVEELAAQAFVFFAAGFETSSTTMTFCLFELASNQEIQENVRGEIRRVLDKHAGEISYEALKEMTYLTQVIEETLRKYPPLPFLTRQSVKDYNIPDTDVTLSKETTILISILGLHHDPEYFPDPEKFDPERFSEENKQKMVPFTYLPFGGGPRICLGLRFGMMQTRIGLILLLKQFRFNLNPKTVVPIEMDPFSLILSSKTGILLDVERV